MTSDYAWFETWLLNAEKKNRGWLLPKSRISATIYLDGIIVNNVLAVHRGKGVVKVARMPLKRDKHGKRVLRKTIRGVVELLPKMVDT